MSRRRVLHCAAVGEPTERELSAAVDWLAQQPGLVVHRVPDVAAARTEISVACDLILFVQSHPGQFSKFQVESLHQVWPLATLVCIYGFWCEGEGRSGRPPAGVWRIAAPTFPARFGAFLQDTNRLTCLRSLPRLVAETERIELEANFQLSLDPVSALILSQSLQAYEPLADALRLIGLMPAWQRPSDPQIAPSPRLVVHDFERGGLADWQQVESWMNALPNSAVLISMGFPRAEDFQRAAAFSAERTPTAVVAKPFRMLELQWELERVTASKQRSAGDTSWAAKSA